MPDAAAANPIFIVLLLCVESDGTCRGTGTSGRPFMTPVVVLKMLSDGKPCTRETYSSRFESANALLIRELISRTVGKKIDDGLKSAVER